MDELIVDNVESLSPYTKFMIENIGYYFQNKKNNKPVDKWEIWATFEDDLKSLSSIYLNRHSLYRRVKK